MMLRSTLPVLIAIAWLSTASIAYAQAPSVTDDEAPSAAPQLSPPAPTAGHGIPPGNVVPPIRPNEPTAVAAKTLFGAAGIPAPLAARAIGAYSRGCLAGGVALPIDGPAWQAMRLSRNRNWGHPKLVALVQRFAEDVKAKDGWPGLLVGDISQPRGGPMLTGHASHQIGLDADIWFTPMPDRRLSKTEREEMSAVSMLDKTQLAINPAVFSDAHVRILKRAASYAEVERVLVHPAIKKAICQTTSGQPDRGWLAKVRPIWGHFYHFHIRIACPAESAGCAAQRPPPGDDGCGKELDDWYKLLTRPPPGPAKPPPPPLTVAQLPADCKVVLEAGRK